MVPKRLEEIHFPEAGETRHQTTPTIEVHAVASVTGRRAKGRKDADKTVASGEAEVPLLAFLEPGTGDLFEFGPKTRLKHLENRRGRWAGSMHPTWALLKRVVGEPDGKGFRLGQADQGKDLILVPALDDVGLEPDHQADGAGGLQARENPVEGVLLCQALEGGSIGRGQAHDDARQARRVQTPGAAGQEGAVGAEVDAFLEFGTDACNEGFQVPSPQGFFPAEANPPDAKAGKHLHEPDQLAPSHG